MSGHRFALALAAASALILGPLSVPALADTVTVDDAAGDVTSALDENGTPHGVDPTRREGDVLATRVTHGKRQVRVLVRYAELTRDPSSTAVHLLAFRTNEGRHAQLDLVVMNKRWQGDHLWITRGKQRSCAGLRTRVDYRHNTVRTVIPRRCLSAPRWVQVGAGNGTFVDGRTYADDAHLSHRVEDALAYGPRVRRG